MTEENNRTLDVKEAGIVETEIAKGEQDDLLDYPKSKEESIQKLRSKTLASRIVKPRSIVEFARNQRIKDLARPTKRHALVTLREKASVLPPIFVDNLIRIVEAESCLTPEEAAQVQRKKRKTKIKRQLPRTEKWMQEISEGIEDSTMLDRDAVMCQYLMAKHFVKSILKYQCRTPKKDIREIADVIMRRLTSYEAYTDVRNDDRAMQQLRLLADIVACWIAEILVEVSDIRKHSLEEYCRKKKMKMEIDLDDDDEMNNETDWKKIELKKEKERREEKEDENKFEMERENIIAEKEDRSENEEQKGENAESEEKENKNENETQKKEITEGEEKENRIENKGEKEEQKRDNREGEALTEKEEEIGRETDEIKKEKNDKEQEEGNIEKAEEMKEE